MEPPPSDPESFVGARMPKSLVDRLDARAGKEGRDRSGMLRWALQAYLDQADGTDLLRRQAGLLTAAARPKTGRGRR